MPTVEANVDPAVDIMREVLADVHQGLKNHPLEQSYSQVDLMVSEQS